MKLLGLVLMPLALSAQLQIVDTDELGRSVGHLEWLQAVDRALDSQMVCQELSLLVESPSADSEVVIVLREILATKCCL